MASVPFSWLEPVPVERRGFPGRVRFRLPLVVLWFVAACLFSISTLWLEDRARASGYVPPNSDGSYTPREAPGPRLSLAHLLVAGLVAGTVVGATAVIASPLLPALIIVGEDAVIRRTGCVERRWPFSELGMCFLSEYDQPGRAADELLPPAMTVLVLVANLPEAGRRPDLDERPQAIFTLDRGVSGDDLRRALQDRGVRVE